VALQAAAAAATLHDCMAAHAADATFVHALLQQMQPRQSCYLLRLLLVLVRAVLWLLVRQVILQ
jgi:hypothetical protein